MSIRACYSLQLNNKMQFPVYLEMKTFFSLCKAFIVKTLWIKVGIKYVLYEFRAKNE